MKKTLANLLLGRGSQRTRAAMRGYRRLNAQGELRRLTLLKEWLTTSPLNLSPSPAFFFGPSCTSPEISVRQFTLSRFAGVDMNESVLAAIGRGVPVIHPMPADWRRSFEAHGFRVARFRSAMLWYAYMLAYFARGAYRIWKQLRTGMKSLDAAPGVQLGSAAHFDGLTEGNLPQPGSDGLSHDIISWYRNWPERALGLKALTHTVPVETPREAGGIPVIFVSSAIQPIVSGRSLLRLLGWGLAATALASFDLIRGRWWHALLLLEAADARVVRAHPNTNLARDYLFHNSNWIYRPLWTYDAEQMGSRILFYFYSSNVEPFKHPDGYQADVYGWGAATWPIYLVWDGDQARFVRRAVKSRFKVQSVGPIWFHDSAEVLPPIPGPAIAVFDIIPFRSSYYQVLGIDLEYYVPDTSIAFLQDIQTVAVEHELIMLWKRKRHMGPLTHRRYRMFADLLSVSSHVEVVSPNVSAVRLIEAADLVISLPFTSTAVLARELGKPSCFYDPTRTVSKDDRGAHGLPIVSGPTELRDWVATHMSGMATHQPALTWPPT